jgi:hypothetical protein
VDAKREFDELFARHRSDIAAYCSWRAATTSDAEDAVAEVFLTAWRRFDRIPERRASLAVRDRASGGRESASVATSPHCVAREAHRTRDNRARGLARIGLG